MNNGEQARQWATKNGLFLVSDIDNYAVVSRVPYLARMILEIDRRPQAHTYELGLKLGYPACCSRKAAQIGEKDLDLWAGEYNDTDFLGLFRMINPNGYRSGKALISHIPCSSKCKFSLMMAMTLSARSHSDFDKSAFFI